MDFKFNEETRKIYINANLSIFLDDYCNASCKFCMNKYEDNFLKAKEIIEDAEYIERLDEVLKKIKVFNPTISITGGKPTLYPQRLIKIIELLKKYNYGKRTFSTNGLNLLKMENGKILFEYLKESEFSRNISISRMAIDDVQILEYIEFYKKMGVKSILFRELIPMENDRDESIKTI